jgi:hypothetical protein
MQKPANDHSSMVINKTVLSHYEDGCLLPDYMAQQPRRQPSTCHCENLKSHILSHCLSPYLFKFISVLWEAEHNIFAVSTRKNLQMQKELNLNYIYCTIHTTHAVTDIPTCTELVLSYFPFWYWLQQAWFVDVTTALNFFNVTKEETLKAAVCCSLSSNEALPNI